MKDYYKILGVAKSASQDEIKSAFKELAKKHHPDRGGDEEKFKEINEAYGVLSNPDQRKVHDNPKAGLFDGLSDFFNVFSSRRSQRSDNVPIIGRDLKYYMGISLYESICGGDKEFKYSFKDECVECKGIGGTNEARCPACGGTGAVIRTNKSMGYQMISRVMCAPCKGRGAIPQDKCEKCNGSGVIDQSEDIIIKLQPNMADGSVLRVAKKGYSGKNGGPNGDLFVKLQIKMPKKENLTDEQLEVLKKI